MYIKGQIETQMHILYQKKKMWRSKMSNNNRLDDTTMPGMLDTAVSSVSLHHRGIIEQEIAEKAKRRSPGYIKTILSPSSSVELILLFSKFH